MEQTEIKSYIKSIAQARAKYAWQCAKDNQNDKEYASLVRKIPTYIKTNGLLNTIAFLYSKSNREKKVLNNIKGWLTDPTWGLINKNDLSKSLKNENEQKNKNDEEYLFIHYLLNSNAHDIMQYTSEVINLFTWLRRFVKSEE